MKKEQLENNDNYYHPRDLLESLGILGYQKFGSHKNKSKDFLIKYLTKNIDSDYDWQILYQGYLDASLPPVNVSKDGTHLYDGIHRCWLYYLMGEKIKGQISTG